MRRILGGLALTTALIVGSSSPAPACSSCKEAMANQSPEEAARLTTGYYYSILLMLAVPATLFGAGSFMVARAVRRGALPEM